MLRICANLQLPKFWISEEKSFFLLKASVFALFQGYFLNLNDQEKPITHGPPYITNTHQS